MHTVRIKNICQIHAEKGVPCGENKTCDMIRFVISGHGLKGLEEGQPDKIVTIEQVNHAAGKDFQPQYKFDCCKLTYLGTTTDKPDLESLLVEAAYEVGSDGYRNGSDELEVVVTSNTGGGGNGGGAENNPDSDCWSVPFPNLP